MKRLLMVLGIVGVLWGSPAWAACTGSSPTWSCSSWTDLKTLVEGASIQTGDTATLAAGTHTAGSTITIPDAKRITITGAGSTCPTSCSTQVTANQVLLFNLGASGSRVTSIQFTFAVNCKDQSVIKAKHTGWRIDHNKFLCSLVSPNEKGDLVFYDNSGCYHPSCQLGGLIDSNYITNLSFYFEGNGASPDGLGASAMAQFAVPFLFGDGQVIFVEDNYMEINDFGHIFDASYGGGYVARFNEFKKAGTVGVSTGSMLEVHGLADATNFRGSRRFEIYKNTGDINEGDWGLLRSGTGVVWGNRFTTSGGGDNMMRFDHRRSPGGSGTPLCDGTQPNYDSNEGVPNFPGYLCRDQIGAGYDSTPHDGSLPLPAQIKMPAYVWDNGSTNIYVVSGVADLIKADRDWFNYSSATGSPQTTGVRVGTKANMPAGCTTGVGYWVTNEGYWNSKTPTTAAGVLYKCTATNTWTAFYVPYLYPHPLRGGLSAPTGVTVK